MRSTALAVLGFAAAALAWSPSVSAGVNVGVHVDLPLPHGVHVSVGNIEPYYVGRVFYEPLAVWRPVYSFPTETPYGIRYEPYVYDGRRVACHDSIPGPSAGYGRFVREGRGYYDTRWSGGGSYARGRNWDDRNDYERSGSGSGSHKRHKKQKHKHGY